MIPPGLSPIISQMRTAIAPQPIPLAVPHVK